MSDTLPKPERPDPGYTQEDWDEASADNPELTDAELAELRPASEVPEMFALLPKRGPGRPRLADAKVNLTLRVDPGLLDAYKATGPGWQVRMHEVLAAARPVEPTPAAAEPQRPPRLMGQTETGRSLVDRHARMMRIAKAKADREAREQTTRPKSA